MGAGQDGEAGKVRLAGDEADDLGLLPAEHVAVAPRVAEHDAGDYRDGAAATGREPQHLRGQPGSTGGAGEVRCLPPALPAADHAGHDRGHLRPFRRQRFERRFVPAGECADAGLALRLVHRRAGPIEKNRPQPGGPPVDGDQRARF